MEIKTRFNVGDKIWVINGNKPIQEEVAEISINIDDNIVQPHCTGEKKLAINISYKTRRFMKDMTDAFCSPVLLRHLGIAPTQAKGEATTIYIFSESQCFATIEELGEAIKNNKY